MKMDKRDSSKAELILKNSKKLETFMLTDDLELFTSLIVDIIELCFNYYEFWDENTKLMPDNAFYSYVKKYFNPLNKFYKF